MTVGRRGIWLLALGLGAGGLWLLGQGVWIPAKAALAQLLLDRAWQASLDSGTPVKAWPWADSAPVARLTLAGRSLTVLSGGSGEALAFGPTLVAQRDGLTVVAGHRDTHFALLRHLAPGQVIGLQQLDGRSRQFRVAWAGVTAAPHWRAPAGTEPGLALVTCWPLEALTVNGPERFVLLATPIPGPDARSVERAGGVPRLS